MLVTLEMNDPRALHVQVADAIRRAIASGDLVPGDRLPPAKEIAGALEVNVNTVLRALRELRDEHLLEFRRGRGVSVRERPDAHGALLGRVRELLDEAHRYGYRPEDVIELIRESSP